jgi:AcrR family transcriptional regulator
MPAREATRRPTKAERAEATRAELIRVARDLFAERGYAGVGTEEIVRTAQVTRGALYHHFRDKRDLFRAVHEQQEQDLVERIGSQMQGVEDPVELLRAGMRAFLDACTEPTVIRITLVDAPTVLGWAEWREIDARHGLGLVTAGLQGAMDAGALRRQEIRPLAHLMLGALGEAAMLIAHADDPKAERDEVEGPLLSLLEGLRAE